ncbi:MBL fold metallo-hydrolase [Alkalihalobacillus sp. BA299]|uniref:MBL fold metallo-hydrolase n=1 Tax=Alkalihalobacillus sp. BA299 TaxID=2815938 RepID=UPI001ADA6D3B|nr:MBL fold metallo-hydrolase [Alkalihalobacillus sp. BA299]
MRSEHPVKVIRIPVPTPTLYPHTTTNCYLIGNKEECVLVDAGYDRLETRKEIEAVIENTGLAQPTSIILTHSHRDHAPGVRQFMDWPLTIYCHRSEEEAIMNAISPVKNISFLQNGESFKVADMEMIVIHGPGHTAGQLNLYIPSEQILLAGDNIVAEGTTWIGPPDGDMSDYIYTLKRLNQLKLTKIGPGHGDWVLHPYEQIDFVLNRRLKREKQIKSLLKDHVYLTATQLTEKIYENTIHPSVFHVATKTTEAHLIKLIKEGIVLQQNSVYSLSN